MAEMKKTLGGDRLGSGNKNKVWLHDYERSTHNLSTKRFTSMAAGVLYPVYCNLALNGDTFEMKIDADTITLPTEGPLFGSFKLQVDVFQCPIRLYQGILHNNPLNIGLKMSQVKFPKMLLEQYVVMPQSQGPMLVAYKDQLEFRKSSLLSYLGIKGIGIPAQYNTSGETSQTIYRSFNALPALSYYDIFKNYYANKQEEYAYVITPTEESLQEIRPAFNEFKIIRDKKDADGDYIVEYHTQLDTTDENTVDFSTLSSGTDGLKLTGPTMAWTVYGEGLTTSNIRIKIPYYDNEGSLYYKIYTLQELINMGAAELAINKIYNPSETENELQMIQWTMYAKDYRNDIYVKARYDEDWSVMVNGIYTADPQEIRLTPFKLTNIDDMRMYLLSHNQLGSNVLLSKDPYDTSVVQKLPYKCLYDWDTHFPLSKNVYPMNGLLVKTYQSDKFNNWVQTDWIDGDNGIAAITAVDTSSGSFTQDALLLAQKTYDMLNRIAVSGGTYEDWQEAVFAQKAIRKAETPMYCGGFSSEVVFQKVVQTSGTDNASEDNVLGKLGGQGITVGNRYGNLKIKVNEPSFIIAIASLTPRIQYSQGNKWYMTDLETMDDVHKPALDGIGFQELITEQLAWFDAKLGPQSHDGKLDLHRRSAGKVPAWQNYMTDVDEVFGDFAETYGTGYMVLDRNYTYDEENMQIKDITTYIDPTKFNYAFAYASLDAQNFWTEVYFDIKARRKMSAKMMPNL